VYPVLDRKISGPIAPDVMVAFEVLSPSNSRMEMANTLRFYDQYGAEAYYNYDPERHQLEIGLRRRESLKRAEQEAAKADRLAERLRALGIDPNHL